MNTLPETPLQLLTLMANTSVQIDVFSDGVIRAVQEGEANPLAVLVQLRAMAQASERILKEIDKNIMSEADKYPCSRFQFIVNKITKAEYGTKYDYSACGDPDLKVFEAEKEKADKNLKDRQDFLKSLKAPIEILRDGGEVVALTPPTKKSKSGLNVSIK